MPREVRGGDEPPDARVGLCSACREARRQTNARGNSFWQCRAAADDPRLRRFPVLPVVSCPAFVRGTPQGKSED